MLNTEKKIDPYCCVKIYDLPKCCLECPFDVPEDERDFCWCKYYIDHFDD